ncbi:MAG: M64 family metallopeptidase, partial [Bacteroidota bacterium]
YEEGSWPGTRTNLVDDLNLGEYGFRVYDLATNTMIFSQGFSSIYNEWQTTDEALAGVYRTFSETVRFPYPKKSVQLTIVRRDKKMVYHEVFTTVIDPTKSTEVNKEKRSTSFKLTPLMNNGAPANKVDIVIVGDGYTKADMEKFRADAKQLNDVLFSTEPFKSRKKDFNAWLVEVEAKESGIDVPDKNVWKRNPLGCQYNTFNTPRYVLTMDNKSLRDAAAAAPYDAICILINDTRYGGGGIFNLYATTYTKEENKDQKWQMEYVYVHEFGHSFAGLGDEYYASQTGYNDFYSPGIEPWEPNVTALVDKKNVKWNGFMTPGVEVPTPWEKAQYDSITAIQSKLDRLAPDYYQKREPLFKALIELRKTSKYAGKVGAFEGAGYASKGLYRPAVDCRMFSLSLVDFDPVCSAALNRVIDYYVK